MNRDWLLQRSTWNFLACSKFPVIFPWQFLLQVVSPQRNVACENSRFSSLLGDVSRGGRSATQQQKFHTDDGKSVRNPVRSADWSTEQLHCFSYCLRMIDKSQKAIKVKFKRDEYYNKTVNICGIQSCLEEAFEFCWSSFVNEHNTLPKSTRRNVKSNKITFGTP